MNGEFIFGRDSNANILSDVRVRVQWKFLKGKKDDLLDNFVFMKNVLEVGNSEIRHCIEKSVPFVINWQKCSTLLFVQFWTIELTLLFARQRWRRENIVHACRREAKVFENKNNFSEMPSELAKRCATYARNDCYRNENNTHKCNLWTSIKWSRHAAKVCFPTFPIQAANVVFVLQMIIVIIGIPHFAP